MHQEAITLETFIEQQQITIRTSLIADEYFNEVSLKDFGNIVGQRENPGYQHFCLFQNALKSLFY